MSNAPSPVDQNPTAPPAPINEEADALVLPKFADVPADRPKTRYAVVGAGHRSGMYVDAIGNAHRDVAELVAWCDTNPTRMEWYDAELGRLLGLDGPAGLPTYDEPDMEAMIAEQKVDVVIITSPDHTHANLISRAQKAGADVVVEKPLTTTAEGCLEIAESTAETGKDVVMTFNYRYSPRNSTLREVIESGEIGTPTSVHFEWVLDTVHGADYFRRWHREEKNSGSLLIHKSSHHFDLVNWWLRDVPTKVYASAGLQFYGSENAKARGMGDRPARGTGAKDDPWTLDLNSDERLKALYLEAEHHDGYIRDKDVFTDGITIWDNMSLVVDYASGVHMTYSLNAHAPWEGYRVVINGTEGRAELTVVERGSVVVGKDGNVVLDPSASPDEVAGDAGLRPEGHQLLVQRHWEYPVQKRVPVGKGGHGGGDTILLLDIFRRDLLLEEDPLGRAAGWLDGVRAVAVGIAANESLRTGKAVEIADLDLGTSLDY